MAEYGTPNTWTSEVIIAKAGLMLNTDALTQGTTQQGSAKVLQNFECALEGGYRRINGYAKWDTAVVPGDVGTPILGIKAALGGAFAVRFSTSTTSNDLYFSTGSGWTKVNTSARAGSVTRARLITYALAKPTILLTDGVNPAAKWDGTTYTTINGTGAPSNPKYAEFFGASLALAGYSSLSSAVSISAPGSDADFNGADGAAEINVGQVIVGLKNFRDSLYVFCTDRIVKITGTDVTTWTLANVTEQIGCVSGDTVQEIGGDLVYLAPDGFRSVAGTYNIGDIDLSLLSRNIQPLMRTSVINNTGIEQFSSCPIRRKSQYRCFFYDPTVPKSNTLGVIGKLEQGSPLDSFNFNYTQYDWSTTSGIQPYCADSYFDGNTERAFIGDPVNGFVYQLESGNDYDGTPIAAIYQSPYVTFKDATLRKVMQKLNIYTEIEGTNTLILNVNYDYANLGIFQPVPQTISFDGAFPIYGAALYGTDSYGGVVFPVFKQNIIGSGFTTSFIFSSIGGAPFRIDSYQVTYGQKGRR